MRTIAMILFAVGLLLIPVHNILLQNQQVFGDDNWLISLDIKVEVKQADTFINIQPPYETANIRLVGRNINHSGLRMSPASRDGMSKRGVRLRATSAGSFHTGMNFTLQLSESPHFYVPLVNVLNTKNRQLYLADDDWLQLEDPDLETLLIDIGLNETDHEQLIERIFQFVYKLANHALPGARKVPRILQSRSANHHERARLMVALSRKAGIPARVITGLELKDDTAASPVYWVEVYINDGWLSYHPGLGYARSLPMNFIAMDKSGDGIVSAYIREGETTVKLKPFAYGIRVEHIPDIIASPDNTRRDWYQIFILERLSAETRAQLSLLMLLPLGALLCSVIRQFAGLNSYGVFTPTMLALAITYADKETTVLILMISIILVYLGRPTFHRGMSRVPRLSIIFTLVALSMVIGVSALDFFALATDGHLILLPMVIITSLIDRLFSTIELNGYHTALVRLLWTFILTLITLPLLQQEWLGAFMLRYPEMHLLTLSLLIMVSTLPFGKYRLPVFFKLLSEPEHKPLNRKSSKDDTE